MTNIVGGNAGKIPHFDQGSDGIAVNGAIKNKTSNFFDLISIISESSLESGKNLSGSEQSAKQNELIFGKQYTQQQDVSSKELVTTQPKQSDLYLGQIMNVIGELQASKDLDTDKTITSSTFSQISGLLNAPDILTKLDVRSQLKTLISSINLELEKLQVGRDFLTIKNSEIGFTDPNQVFLGRIPKDSLSKNENNEISAYLNEILMPIDAVHEVKLQTAYHNALDPSESIKNLPFDNGENGYLLLDLSEFKVNKSKPVGITLVNNLYLNTNHMTNQQIDFNDYQFDAFNLELAITAKGLSAELSNLNQQSENSVKENLSIGNISDLSVIGINVPNKNLAALNVEITIESSQNFNAPAALTMLIFDGNQDGSNFVGPNFDLIKAKKLFSDIQNNKVSNLLTDLGIGKNELVIDSTHVMKSFTPTENNKTFADSSKIVSSDLIVGSEMSLIDKISVNEINNPQFAKFLKEKIQFAVKNVTHKINFKQEIAKFIDKSGAALIIQEVVSKVAKKELGLGDRINIQKELFLSSADVISYREAISNKGSKAELSLKSAIKDILKVGGEELDLPFKFADEKSVSVQNLRSASSIKSNFEAVLQSSPEQNIAKVESTMDRSINNQSQNFSQRLSILESQFSVRLANALLEKAINSHENFDLILEPETFGKVRVNVSIDSSQIDVKLTAENSATLAILRASESMLHSISEQNGLKLAEYNVELNNNAQNNEGSNGRKDGKDQKSNLNEGVETLEDTLDPLNQDDDVHSLNLIA